MLKRCSPRRISALVTGMGKSFDSLPSAPLPVASSVSSLRWPRATVPSVMGRAERPSAKKSLGRKGMYFGWSCMSWRHPDSRTSDSRRMVGRTPRSARVPLDPPLADEISFIHAPASRRGRRPRTRGSAPPRRTSETASLVRNFRYLPGLQRLQERARFVAIEQWIVGFDAQEETVAAGQRESRHVEGGVIEHRQTAQRQQAENGGERRKQNRHLKRDDDVGGPTVQRPSADINRVVDHRHEI